MLQLAITFLVIALIAAFFGFAGVAALSWEGRRYSLLSSSFSPCCLSWGMGSEGGTSGSSGSANIVRSSLTLLRNAQDQGRVSTVNKKPVVQRGRMVRGLFAC